MSRVKVMTLVGESGEKTMEKEAWRCRHCQGSRQCATGICRGRGIR
jgi:hypothetical protein